MSRSRKSASDFGPAELEKKIQGGHVEPLYLFLGEDDYLKDSAIRKLVNTVDEGFREFNIERLYVYAVADSDLLKSDDSHKRTSGT